MKVHLGCGNKILKGWTNCDIQNLPGVDIVSAFEDLNFELGSVSEIYVCHMLEHFSRHEIQSLIKKLAGWLKPGGKIWVAVPDFEACVKHYSKYQDVPALLGLIMGGQKNEWDFHKMLFDFNLLNKYLMEAGFNQIQRYERSEHDVAKQGIDDYSAAFLPHMDSNGLLMSLNVVAIKK